MTSRQPTIHPVDLGDLPGKVQLRACEEFFGLEGCTLRAHWKARYASFLFREDGSHDLWVNVKKADEWLDERGRALLSGRLLAEKKRRNPGWKPLSESLRDAIAQRAASSL